MAISLLDLLGFGRDRAIENAGREMLRRRTEERLIEDLVDALARHDGQFNPLRPWLLDYMTSDEPEALNAAREALRGLGLTVAACEVRPAAAGTAVVNGTVELPSWLDVPAVEYALRRAGATDVRAVPVRCDERRSCGRSRSMTGAPAMQRAGR